jgi:hypothetical protein
MPGELCCTHAGQQHLVERVIGTTIGEILADALQQPLVQHLVSCGSAVTSHKENNK